MSQRDGSKGTQGSDDRAVPKLPTLKESSGGRHPSLRKGPR